MELYSEHPGNLLWWRAGLLRATCRQGAAGGSQATGQLCKPDLSRLTSTWSHILTDLVYIALAVQLLLHTKRNSPWGYGVWPAPSTLATLYLNG